MKTRQLAALCAVALAAPLLVLAGSARAATTVVTLSGNGPTPASATIRRGDTVTFRNSDSVSHTVRRTAGAWTFSKTIAAGTSAVTPAFGAAGSYGYEDTFTTALLPRSVDGTITVTAATPTRSPTASPRPSATRSPTPAPSRSAAPSPSPSATPSATASGLAIIPPIGIVTMAPTGGPTPNLAPPAAPVPSVTTETIAYGSQSGLVQSSPHKYGLPIALALLLALGVLSLIVRLLLSM